MTPGKILIAHRLDDCANSLEAVVALMAGHAYDRRLAAPALELARAGETARFLAADIRATEEKK